MVGGEGDWSWRGSVEVELSNTVQVQADAGSRPELGHASRSDGAYARPRDGGEMGLGWSRDERRDRRSGGEREREEWGREPAASAPDWPAMEAGESLELRPAGARGPNNVIAKREVTLATAAWPNMHISGPPGVQMALVVLAASTEHSGQAPVHGSGCCFRQPPSAVA